VLRNELVAYGKGRLVDVQKVTPTQVAVRSNTIECPVNKATSENLILTPTQVLWNKLIDRRKKTSKKIEEDPETTCEK